MMKSEEKTKNLPKSTGFDFDSGELIELDSIIKGKKYDTKGEINLVYPSDPITKLKYFINCMRLLEHVAYHVTHAQDKAKEKVHKTLRTKIKKILEEYNSLYVNAEVLQDNLLRDSHYARHRLKQAVSNFVIEKGEKINKIMDFVYRTGKNITQVDPNETLGHF